MLERWHFSYLQQLKHHFCILYFHILDLWWTDRRQRIWHVLPLVHHFRPISGGFHDKRHIVLCRSCLLSDNKDTITEMKYRKKKISNKIIYLILCFWCLITSKWSKTFYQLPESLWIFWNNSAFFIDTSTAGISLYCLFDNSIFYIISCLRIYLL